MSRTDGDPIVVVRDVHHRYGSQSVLAGLDMDVPRDGVTVLLGRNGSGKSTLLRLLLGAMRPTSGRVEVLGKDPFRYAGAVRQELGFVPDVPDASDWMTPREWLRFVAPHYRRFDVAASESLAERLRVPLDRRFRHLSRGEGMLAMWAAAVGHAPPLVLLDEPFGGLDPIARDDVLRAVIDELRESGRAVLLTTHDLEMASRVADRVALLMDGVIRWAESMAVIEETEGAPLPARLRERMRAADAGSAGNQATTHIGVAS